MLLAELFFSAFNLTFPHLFYEWKNLSGSLYCTENRKKKIHAGIVIMTDVCLVSFLQIYWKTGAVLFQIKMWGSTCFFCCQDKLSILNVTPHDLTFDLDS